MKIADFGIAKLLGQTTVPVAALAGASDVVGKLERRDRADQYVEEIEAWLR